MSLSSIGKFIDAQTTQEKADAIVELENQYGNQYSPEFFQNIRSSDEWNGNLQKQCLDRYLNDRQEELDYIKRDFLNDFKSSWDQDWEEPNEEENIKFFYNSMMMVVVQNIGGDITSIVDQVISMAKSDDTGGFRNCGNQIMINHQQYFVDRFDDIIEIMSQEGFGEYPYRIGSVFNYVIDHDESACLSAVNCLATSKNNALIGNILLALSSRKDFPDLFDEHIVKVVKNKTEETKSIAITVVGIKPKLARSLEEELWLGLSDEQWFIRGNSAYACGNTQLSPDRFIPKLMELVLDFEGHDWCAGQRAIEALGKYGKLAVSALPTIEMAKKKWLKENDYDTEYFIKICEEAKLLIRDA